MDVSETLAAVSERTRQNRTARTLDATSGTPARGVVSVTAAGTFQLGDRVLDVATGQFGTVTGAGLGDKLLRGDVRVHLEDGRDVIRGAFGLLYRPKDRDV